jgi:hypothetical protein
VPRKAAEEETLKTKSFIAALILAAAVLSPASAAPILLTAVLTAGSSGNPLDLNLSSGAGYIVATGYSASLTGTLPPTKNSSVTISETTSATVGVNSSGLGLANNSDEIGPAEFVVLDFADHAATYSGQAATGVTFKLNVDVKEPSAGASYWVVYGLTTNNGTGTPALLASGEMTTLGAVPTITTAYYSSYVIGIIGDCDINITGIGVQYGAPEPGTFVMGGMALIGLGIAMKKRSRKV